MLKRILLPPKSAPAERTIMTVSAGSHRVPVVLRVSDRARRIGLRLGQKADAFVLTMPRRAREQDAIHFAENHRGWMEARLVRLPQRVPFAPDAVIPLRGKDHRLITSSGVRGVVEAREGDIIVPGLPEHFSRKVTDFLKKQARIDLDNAVEHYCRTIGVSARRICLRDPATRWGSCSSTGTLSFSWRLIMAPPDVLDYLAAHEVVHIQHMHHGPAFWRLLKQICQATPQAEAWLKRHGRSLHAYGSA